jgi:stage II sporulation protein AB (anti-sigma F factor)
MKELKKTARISFSAVSENESFARIVTSGFLMNLGVTPSLLADLKTVVSEAVTNAIVHGYRGKKGSECKVLLDLKYYNDRSLVITVSDRGVGIGNIEEAMQPFFTTDREGERSGMGLPIMQAFSDSMKILSSPKGTKVVMRKKLP